MPLAFFCTLFFRHRKKSVSAPWDGKSQFAPESARQAPSKGNFLRQSCLLSMQCRGLSSGQTIGAVRTAVRPACCLPELRGANRLRRLYPLDTRFPPFPPAPLRIATRSNRAPHRAASPSSAPESARQAPPGAGVCACGRTKGLSSGQTIGAVRTAVRPACCLPELRGANRLRRLYPLDTHFPPFPFGNLRAGSASKSIGIILSPKNAGGFPRGTPSPKNDRHVPKHAGHFSLAASVSPVAHRRMALYFSAQTACTFSMAFCTSSSVRVRSAARKVREKATLFLPSPT